MALCYVGCYILEQSTVIFRPARQVFNCSNEFRDNEFYCTGFRNKSSFRSLIFNGMFQKYFSIKHNVELRLCTPWRPGGGSCRIAPLILNAGNTGKWAVSRPGYFTRRETALTCSRQKQSNFTLIFVRSSFFWIVKQYVGICLPAFCHSLSAPFKGHAVFWTVWSFKMERRSETSSIPRWKPERSHDISKFPDFSK